MKEHHLFYLFQINKIKGVISLSKTKIYILFISALLIFLPACSSADNSPTKDATNQETSEQTEKATFVISKDKGEEVIKTKDVDIKKDDILLDVLEEHFDVETDEEGSFITSIEGIKAKKETKRHRSKKGEQKAWIYTVNDEMGTVGADQYKLQPDDKVEFDFQEWE